MLVESFYVLLCLNKYLSNTYYPKDRLFVAVYFSIAYIPHEKNLSLSYLSFSTSSYILMGSL